MKKRWKLTTSDTELAAALGKGLSIRPLTAQLLINRGLVDCDRASCFLNPSLRDLHDPYLLKDMDRAVERLCSAIERGESIAIYGDYDVDGTTSAALMLLFLKEIGVEAQSRIPDRMTEGYGLNAAAVKDLAAAGVRLIITVDCGSSDHAEIELASSLGMDVIVTDHHEVSCARPPCRAFLNPKQQGCAFPFKGLAGVGVAFNFLLALRSALREAAWFTRETPNMKRYLDLVSIGTVADMVPLVDENRTFVKHGLVELGERARPGLDALMKTAGMGSARPGSDDIAFKIAPRINAAGRVARATDALKLLVTGDPAEAASLAERLDNENRRRQALERETLEEALSMIGDTCADRAVVLAREDWHPGVIGIVASRLVERLSRPVVMIALDGAEPGKGSARGAAGFDILKGLSECARHLERFGGHRAAAGLTVKKENVAGFKREFTEIANSMLTDRDLSGELALDAAVSLDEVDLPLVDEFERLAPFGVGNRKPLLCVEDAGILKTEVVGRGHLRVKLKQNGCARWAIGFGMGKLHPISGNGFSVAFSPGLDEWRGARGVQLKIKDVKKL